MAPPSPPESVVVHPLVMLSVQDHYNRVGPPSSRPRRWHGRRMCLQLCSEPAVPVLALRGSLRGFAACACATERLHPAGFRDTRLSQVAKDTRKRVVGVLLGESYKGRVDCTNSFAGAAGC